MKQVVTAEEMRACDRAEIGRGTPSAELMRRAGHALAETVRREAGGLPAVFVCGRGNNGGDGFAAAAEYCGRALLWELPGRRTEDCERFALAAAGIPRVHTASDLPERYVAADCLLGTGFHGTIPSEYAEGLGILRGAERVIACDLPSGLHADAGTADPACVPAAVTVTFAAAKYGQLLADGKDVCGRLEIADIGIPLCDGAGGIVTAQEAGSLFPVRKQNCHKGRFERISLVGGSAEYPGSVAIAAKAEAALRCGCGYATVVCPRSLRSVSCLENTLRFCGEESLVCDETVLGEVCRQSDAVVCGMGMGQSEEGAAIVRYLLKHARRLILDADALNVLASDPEVLRTSAGEVYLTPHPGEFSRLTGRSTAEIAADPLGLARDFAARFRVGLLLKGVSSLITDGERVYVNATGSAALAKAGSGDALDGFCAVPVCRGGLLGLAVGSYLHGRCAQMAEADLGTEGVLASDLARYAGRAIAEAQNAFLLSGLEV